VINFVGKILQLQKCYNTLSIRLASVHATDPFREMDVFLDESSDRVQSIRDAAVDEAEQQGREIFVISHGVALAEPEDVAYSMAHTTGTASSARRVSSACRRKSPSRSKSRRSRTSSDGRAHPERSDNTNS
jgi:predicted TIM-barrel enzyme